MNKLKAVVFDWAGTMIDFGSFAPMGVFVKAFERFGVAVTIEQARGPMGLPKLQHIESMMQLPAVAQGWQAARGHAEQFARMSEADKAPIRQRATRSLKDAGADHVIDSVADLLPLLRRHGAV